MTEENKTTTKKTSRAKVTPKTVVTIYNNTPGYLKYSAKKGTGFFELEETLDSDTITVEDLMQMRNSTHKRVLEQGWIYVDNEDVLDYLNLGKLKEKVKSPLFIKKLIEEGNPQKIVEVTESLGTESRIALYNFMRDEYKAGNFGNAFVIKKVEEILGVADTLLDI